MARGLSCSTARGVFPDQGSLPPGKSLSRILNCVLLLALKGKIVISVMFRCFSLPLKTGNNLGVFVCWQEMVRFERSRRIKVKFTDVQ